MLKHWLLFYLLFFPFAAEIMAQSDTLPLSPKIPNWEHLAIDRSDSTVVIKVFTYKSPVPENIKVFNIKKQNSRAIEFKTENDDSSFASFISSMGMDIERKDLLAQIGKQQTGRTLIVLVNSPGQLTKTDSIAIANAINPPQSLQTPDIIIYVLAGILLAGIAGIIFYSRKNNSLLRRLLRSRNTYTITNDLIEPLLKNRDHKNKEQIIHNIVQEYEHNQAKQNQGTDALKAELEKKGKALEDKEKELEDERKKLTKSEETVKNLEITIGNLNTSKEQNEESTKEQREIAQLIDKVYYGPMIDKIKNHKLPDKEAKKIVLEGLLKIALHSISLNRWLIGTHMNSDKLNTKLLFNQEVLPEGFVNSQSQGNQTTALPYYILKILGDYELTSLDGVLINGYQIANQ